MWELVTTLPSIDAAFEKLEQEFDVQPALLRENLTQLLSQLVENGLLAVLPADVGTLPAV
jgi:hypothetical protein